MSRELKLTIVSKDNKWLKYIFSLTFLDTNEDLNCIVDDLILDIPNDSKCL